MKTLICYFRLASLLLFLFSRAVSLCRAWTIRSRRYYRFPSSLSAAIYFRGRSVPYAETYEEQKSRELWEKQTFQHTTKLVDTVLSKETEFPNHNSSLLRRKFQSNTTLSGYEDLFSPLYGSGDGVFGKIEFIEPPNHRKDKLRHFLIRVAYRGSDFCGWQRQPSNDVQPSVQETLEDHLYDLTGRLKGSIRVCGRTDSGVSAIGQVCRFRTTLELKASDISEHLKQLPSTSVKANQVAQVTRAFHPTFTARCRAYAYTIDCWDGFEKEQLDLLNQQLRSLEGKELDYLGMSYGKLKTSDSLCTLYHARASLVTFDDGESNSNSTAAVCIELVGNRFLRRMVRILVEASIRLVFSGTKPETDDLQNLIEAKDRKLIRNMAPPDGLLFVGARFNVF